MPPSYLVSSVLPALSSGWWGCSSSAGLRSSSSCHLVSLLQTVFREEYNDSFWLSHYYGLSFLRVLKTIWIEKCGMEVALLVERATSFSIPRSRNVLLFFNFQAIIAAHLIFGISLQKTRTSSYFANQILPKCVHTATHEAIQNLCIIVSLCMTFCTFNGQLVRVVFSLMCDCVY